MTRPSLPPLTQEEIIQLARAGKSDEEIIQTIQARRTHYRLAARDIIHLHQNGVSERVIDHMIQTHLEAVRDEQRRFDSHYYWHSCAGRWYYCPPPSVIVIKRK